MGDENKQEPTNEVNIIGVKLPPFWKCDPAAWFKRAEAQFRLAHVSKSQTKFDHILTMLDEDIIGKVSDILDIDNTENAYQNLKDRLINTYGRTEEDKFRELISGISLGDEKPSLMLSKIKSLAGNNCPSHILKQMWLQRLPNQAQIVLAVAPKTATVDELAEMADRVVDVSLNTVNQIQEQYKPSNIEDKIADLQQQIKQLQLQRGRTYSRNKPGSHSRSKSRSRFNADGPLCYFHYKFRNKAQKCLKPCKWTSQKPSDKTEN